MNANPNSCPWCQEHKKLMCLSVGDTRILSLDYTGHLEVHDESKLALAVQALNFTIANAQAQLSGALDTLSLYSIVTGALAQYVGDRKLPVVGLFRMKEGQA